MAHIAIIGTTSWGTTLGVIWAQEGLAVRLWARTRPEVGEYKKTGISRLQVPGLRFPARFSVTSSLRRTLTDARAVVLVVPSQSMRQNVRRLSRFLDGSMLIISAAKGLESGSGKRMSQVIAEEIDPAFHPNICVLSGPNLSREILRGLPAATVVAAESETIARNAQKLLSTSKLCVYHNTDVIGVELGGALKNIIALAAGVTDGLGYGDNAKATLITRGLAEITALGVALGANPLTFSGLAGLGDLMATCASPLSRNHHVGFELGRGRCLEEILATMDGVAEGVTTTAVTWELARHLGLEMPITEKIYQVLYMGVELSQAVKELMGAQARHELAGRKWQLSSLFRRQKRSQVEQASR